MALGAERKNAREINDGLDLWWDFGVFGVFDGVVSVRRGGIRLSIPIGGGAAESNDEARVVIGPAVEGRRELSSPSRKMAGPVLSLLQGSMLKSGLDGT
jgi:hypothetical protein